VEAEARPEERVARSATWARARAWSRAPFVELPRYFADTEGAGPGVAPADLHGNAAGLQRAEIAKTPFGRASRPTWTALAGLDLGRIAGMRFNLPQGHARRSRATKSASGLFFFRGGPMDFSCASCHGEDGKRIRLQDLPNLTKNPGDGIGFAAWPAYRVSSGEMWSMQLRLNDCYRQQRFPYPGFASDVTIALGVYMGVNAKGAESIAPAIKR
jgi:sulfur-oxidizing protein SoxA